MTQIPLAAADGARNRRRRGGFTLLLIGVLGWALILTELFVTLYDA